MENILQKLDKMNEEVEIQVEVLLATFNGAKYLPEFLDSLINQSGVKINLKVSDDGSRDETIAILEKYRKYFLNFSIKQGPQQGPSENFFSLLKISEGDFVALADQDDIWEPDHLIKSIKRLQTEPEIAKLSYSSVLEFTEYNSEKVTWPQFKPSDFPGSFLFQNHARGCTIMLNRSSVKLVNFYTPKNAVMHDWWLALLIQSCGKIVFSETPEVFYRIHKHNFIGPSKKLRKRFIPFLRSTLKREWKPLAQLQELKENYFWAFSHPYKKEYSKPIFLFSFSAQKLRSNLLEDIVIRILCFSLSLRASKWISKQVSRKIKSGSIKATFFVYSLPMRIRELRGRTLSEIPYKKYENLSFKLSQKIAILAVFPRDGLQASVLNLVHSLKFQNYSILMVINESANSSQWFTDFSEYTFLTILRRNFGRDFAAYQVGFEYLNKRNLLKDCQRLLFVNDSMYYYPDTKHLIKEFSENHAPWVTMFSSHEFELHAQSFFQEFSRDIFLRRSFIDFWQTYMPSDLRRSNILKGEIAFSRVVKELGFLPNAIVSLEKVYSLFNPNEILKSELRALWFNSESELSELEKLNETQISIQFVKVFQEKNPTHYAGLLSSRLMNAPLKLDLLKFGAVSEHGLRVNLRSHKLLENEIDLLINGPFSSGISGRKSKLFKAWQDLGYI